MRRFDCLLIIKASLQSRARRSLWPRTRGGGQHPLEGAPRKHVRCKPPCAGLAAAGEAKGGQGLVRARPAARE